jgi:[amino group carrier protein]-L-2-aminoadipate 6-kinase
MTNRLVVKIGGGAGLDMTRCARDVARVAQERPVVVVHGVSDALNRLCEARGVEVRTLTSPTGHTSRYTDPQTRDLFVEAAESVNAELVALLRENGVEAVGVTGAICGERKTAVRAVVDGRVRIVRDDYSGTITGVNTDAILSASGVVVLPPLALSADGLLNVDGDRASAAVAAALDANDLVILSNVRGLYRVFGDEATFVDCVSRDRLDTALGWAEGRMKRKVIGAQEALDGGVRRVVIADGRVEMPVQGALNGIGTQFLNR